MKLFRYKFLVRTLSVFLIIQIFSSTLMPTLSWALTAGPTAPEATSFEPVDTTDMVNLATGDFVYNIPLLEVPGSSGGYPLSLSYHAGIMPDEDASWVGLGWTLNPGAINRNVSGYPDDLSSGTGITRTFWAGGVSKNYSYGITVGQAGSSGITAGLSYSEDTYLGTSQTYFIDAGGQSIQHTITDNNGFVTKKTSASAQVGIGLGQSVKLTYEDSGVSGSLSSLESANGMINNISQKVESFKNMDLSLSSVKTYLSSRIGITSSSSKSGQVSTSVKGFKQSIPTPWNIRININVSSKRYWIDEKTTTTTNGALYFPLNSSSVNLDQNNYDVYDLKTFSEIETVNPSEELNGSFIDYDVYNVLAQGIAGSIRPYHFRSYLMRKNEKRDNIYYSKSLPLGNNNSPVNFRFVGDFSNRFEYAPQESSFITSNQAPALKYNFDGVLKTGKNSTEAYDQNTNRLFSSRHVEWYTNEQIVDKSSGNSAFNKGFIDTKSFTRTSDKKIGGFSVTNESGITYHYALPVYSYDEQSYSGRLDYKGKHYFNYFKKPDSYAFTWLLTAVTGPDFLDKNQNGYADKGDFGYWVNFDYGLWNANYNWRNPGTGFNKDVDQDFENFSKGKKQVYYLNSISTNSHTAFFVKGFRLDGKGVVPEYSEAVKTVGSAKEVDDGGFLPRDNRYPVNTLKLKQIYILHNDDLKDFEDIGKSLREASGATIYDDETGDLIEYHENSEVIDSLDLQVEPFKTLIRSKSIKSVKFDFDYSLCPGTENSYTDPFTAQRLGISSTTAYRGKLTLKALQFIGKQELIALPKVKFEYDSENFFDGSISHGQSGSYLIETDGSHFSIGDILKIKSSTWQAYGYITDFENGLIKASLFTRPLFSDGLPIKISKTKNPPYSRERLDLWGFYKLDFQNLGSENASRMTTNISSKNLDVWSLRSIKTSLGSTIRITYQPDRYKSSLKPVTNVPLKDVKNINSNSARITLYEKPSDYGLKPGDRVSYAVLTRNRINIPNGYPFFCNGAAISTVYKWYYDYTKFDPTTSLASSTVPILSVDGYDLIVPGNIQTYYPDVYIERNATSGDANENYRIDHPYISGYVDANIDEQLVVGGELIYDNSISSPYGGGIAVSSISLDDGLGKIRTTNFTYLNGITSYEPTGFSVPIRKLTEHITPCAQEDEEKAIELYRKRTMINITYKNYFDLFTNSRELPAPGVQYGIVRVSENIENSGVSNSINGIKEYEFENFSPDNVNVNTNSLYSLISRPLVLNSTSNTLSDGATQIDGLLVSNVKTQSLAEVRDFTSLYGALKRLTVYSDDGIKLTETRNLYLHDQISVNEFKQRLENKFQNQGLLTETFVDARLIRNSPGQFGVPENSYTLYGLVNRKIFYPSIQIGEEVTNFKTGITTKTENISFDYYTGSTVKTLSNDEFGTSYITYKAPAYEKYPGMSFKALGGKNMLTQEAYTVTYKVIPSVSSQPIDNTNYTPVAIVSASAQTWSDQIPALRTDVSGTTQSPQPGIWRKQASYSFIGNDAVPLQSDGLHPASDFVEFNAWSSTSQLPAKWQKNGEITLYDVASHALEAKDMNGDYAATKTDSKHERVLATVANAAYTEFAYSGAEDEPIAEQFGGQIFKVGALSGTKVHTGKKSLSANAGQTAFKFTATTTAAKKMYVSFWSDKNDAIVRYKINGQAAVTASMMPVKQSGNWYQHNALLPEAPANASIEIWCEAVSGTTYFDDFRVHPYNAAMLSYVYNQWGELSHILDNNNLFTEYIYDDMGRLIETKRETFSDGVVRTSSTEYHYKNLSSEGN